MGKVTCGASALVPKSKGGETMHRYNYYLQVALLKALYYSCQTAAEWDRDSETYIAALEEMRGKQRWLRNVNRVKKEVWLK